MLKPLDPEIANNYTEKFKNTLIVAFGAETGKEAIDELDSHNFFELWRKVGSPSIKWTIDTLQWRGIEYLSNFFEETLNNGYSLKKYSDRNLF